MTEETEIEAVTEAVAEIAADVIAAPLEAAVEGQELAEEAAEQIAAAAMETVRGQRVEILETRLEECLTTMDQLPGLMGDQFRLLLEPMHREIARLSAVADAPRVIVEAPEPILSELTPPLLEPLEEVQPEALPEPIAETPAVVESRRKHRFL